MFRRRSLRRAASLAEALSTASTTMAAPTTASFQRAVSESASQDADAKTQPPTSMFVQAVQEPRPEKQVQRGGSDGSLTTRSGRYSDRIQPIERILYVGDVR